MQETWTDLIDGLLPVERQSRLQAHLQSCRICRETVATLEIYVEEARQPLSAELGNRLRAISTSRRSRPPIWVRQARYAAAASYFLVVMTYLAIGNPVSAAREKLIPIRENAATVLNTGRTSFTEHSKDAFAASTARWSKLRTEVWNTSRSWTEYISTSWSHSRSGEDDKTGPAGDKENDAP